jgi:hypothetical protein
MWGGAFLWTRKPGWRPSFALVDGVQVDYAWIDDRLEAPVWQTRDARGSGPVSA